MNFNKIVVMDNIVLFPELRARLNSLAAKVVWVTQKLPAETAGQASEQYCILPAWDVAQIRPQLKDADAILTCWRPVDQAVLDATPNLRYVGFWTNLWRHRIDPKEVLNRGIHVDYLPDYGTKVVSEYVFAGLLEIARRPSLHHKETARGSWVYEQLKTGKRIVQKPEDIPDWSLAGKNLGIVGLGKIGQRVAQIGSAFGMNVAYYSKTRKPQAEGAGINYLPLDELCRWCDVLSIHTSPEAVGVVTKEHLATMKDQAVFVNTAVGTVVDQAALLEELHSGRLRAFLDVYENLPPRKELKDLPNVIFSYRAGWFTKDSVALKGRLLLDKMEAYLKGEPHTGCGSAELLSQGS